MRSRERPEREPWQDVREGLPPLRRTGQAGVRRRFDNFRHFCKKLKDFMAAIVGVTFNPTKARMHEHIVKLPALLGPRS